MPSIWPEQVQRLYAALGDHLAGGRRDGLFAVRLGGPGSAAGLDGLAPAEWQLDLLPFPPGPEQRQALAALGYALREERAEALRFTHPDGLDVVVLSHALGASHRQQLLWSRLGDASSAAARAHYRQVFRARGRDAADEALSPWAQRTSVAQTGFGPLERAAVLLSPLGLPWMFAAGWAIDLHRHTVTGAWPSRPHDDVDVIVPLDAQLEVGAVLEAAGYRVSAVRDGAYGSWLEPLSPPDYQLHAHRDDAEMLDLMLTDLSGDRWHFRRDLSITLPLDRARRRSLHGLPYLAPEAALLFKARSSGGVVRPKDQQDFAGVVADLDLQARTWLAAHLGTDHPWHSALST